MAPAFELELSAGVESAPAYSGSNSSVTQLRLWADVAYHTADSGTIAFDSGSLTIDPELRWDFIESADAGFGPLLGYRSGRNDTNPRFFGLSSGSEALRGLPNVAGTADVGVVGYRKFLGLPIFVQLRSAISGAQGTLAILGAFASFPIGESVDLTVLSTATWANARQMRAFYGVEPAASLASGFASYTPNAGWQDAAVEIGADWRFAGPWHLVASIALERLVGAAAASPIVTNKNQISGLLGLTWRY